MKIAHAFLPALFLLSNCVDTDEEFDDELDETSQQVTLPELGGYICTNQQLCTFDLGSAANDRACFLSGIRGAAAIDGGFGYGDGSLSTIWISGGKFYLTIYPPVGNYPIVVNTTCVSGITNRTASAHWQPGFPTPIQIANSPNTRCFLTQVGMFGGGMTHYNDSVRTWRDATGKWFLGGSSQTGFVDANATCFDAANVGEWSWGQGVPGSITGNLASNTNHDVGCGLTEIGGVFLTNSDGVSLGFTTKAKTQWNWTLANYKHGAANCIK